MNAQICKSTLDHFAKELELIECMYLQTQEKPGYVWAQSTMVLSYVVLMSFETSMLVQSQVFVRLFTIIAFWSSFYLDFLDIFFFHCRL